MYKVVSYVSTLPLSPAGATFDAHWEYEDVGFGVLGVQDISYVAPVGLGVLATVSSLPLAISVPAGHPTLKVSGFFKLTADSDDFMGGPPPFDTLIAIVPEPATGGHGGARCVGVDGGELQTAAPTALLARRPEWFQRPRSLALRTREHRAPD